MRILLVEPGKAPRPTEIGDGLESMQVVVGGSRVLRLDTGEIYDVIAGTFFLCAAPPDSDRFASLTEEQIARYSERFRAIELFPEVRHG